MVSSGRVYTLDCFVFCFTTVLCFVPHHSQIKGNVKSLLKLTPWNWKHLNTSVKVDTPVSVDISVLSNYRLSVKDSKYQNIQRARDCSAILKSIPHTKGRNGVYMIYPDLKTKKLAYCDMTTEGGGWTVIQRRIDGSVDFYRPWKSYKEGFGNAEGEYWLGNEVIHSLTTKTKQELRVDLQNFSGKKAFAKYSTFTLGSESQKYKLTVGGYSGTAGDSLTYHNGRGFSTKDQDNDSSGGSCAVSSKGAWWFNSCLYSHLNGPYHKSAVKSAVSVVWYHFGNEYRSMKFARMMIRPKS
ncbi:ryncolin-1-like [Saccostrea cucullata]|uniref:ryncolin-1-like n=1 Tax=Saccostrea cuccullata TaxID=36930 RepID=UPI002ED23011